MRGILLLGLGAVTASCSYTATAPVGPSPMAQDRLVRELSGLVPGQPESCLPRYRSQDMIVVDDRTLLFREGRNRVYRNNLNGSCPVGGGYALVTRSTGSGLCRGDIAEVTDVQNRVTVGSCVLGDFIPYTRP